MGLKTEFGDFGSDDPIERYNAHQAAKGKTPPAVSKAASILGQRRSPAKAKAARINGCKGGRPPGNSHQRRRAKRAATK